MRQVESPSSAHMEVDGRAILNFGGSCYLGLSNRPELIAAGEQALRRLGSTSQLPRHYQFASAANLDVEAAARNYFGTGGAMYFATGYLFGPIAMSGLAPHYDVAFLDESGHYNLRDGALAAGKRIVTFQHEDASDLQRKLRRELAPSERPLVATDGMFPTFGNTPPLAEYARLLAPYSGWLLVDESHSFGVLGASGRGAAEHEGVAGERVVAGGSLGKAFCAYGGLAVGAQTAIDDLWKSNPARGAASGMASGAAMAAASMRYLRRHPELLTKLRANTAQLKTGLHKLGLSIRDTQSPVATFVAGTAADMQALNARLWEDGIYLIYSTYVGAGPQGAIRIAAFADHDSDDIERLLEALRRYL